jgi:hypothetical protein
MTPEALQYLQRRLDDARNLRLMPFTRDRPDVVSSALASAGGALEALRGVGLISDAEASEWNARFWEAITGERLPELPAVADEDALPSVTDMATAVAVPVPGAEAAAPPIPAFQAIGFRRLIPGPDEERAHGPGVLRIVALLVFEDGVEVDWLFSFPPDADLFAPERDAVAGDLAALPPQEQADRLRYRDHLLRYRAVPYDFALSDDVGTAYQPHGGGAGGGPVTIHGHQGFTPTLPAEATRVYIDAGEAKFTMTIA